MTSDVLTPARLAKEVLEGRRWPPEHSDYTRNPLLQQSYTLHSQLVMFGLKPEDSSSDGARFDEPAFAVFEVRGSMRGLAYGPPDAEGSYGTVRHGSLQYFTASTWKIDEVVYWRAVKWTVVYARTRRGSAESPSDQVIVVVRDPVEQATPTIDEVQERLDRLTREQNDHFLVSEVDDEPLSCLVSDQWNRTGLVTWRAAVLAALAGVPDGTPSGIQNRFKPASSPVTIWRAIWDGSIASQEVDTSGR